MRPSSGRSSVLRTGWPQLPLDLVCSIITLLYPGPPIMISSSMSAVGKLLLGVALVAATSASLGAQQPAAPPATPTPEVGSMAPDFTVAGATRYGLLRDSVRLSDFRGQTVVLAFFFQARTKG